MKLLLLSAIILLSTYQLNAQKAEQIKFQSIGFEEALTLAKKEGKGVLVNYSTKGCVPCRQMEANVYTNASLASYVNKHFISLKLDPVKDSQLRQMAREQHQVKGFPTLIFFNAEGMILTRNTGFMDAETMQKLADEAIKHSSFIKK
ncbi:MULTISPECIES: thioredoxin family protein [unclassified Carboxylicivirga]|uniref:thioredoxin family protein n=1 Tax=Carboxylicivirga TaxID=1628153 RepID=UPI003D33C8F1